MPIETADDIELFFDDDDFGTGVSAVVEGLPIAFNAIFTDAHDAPTPGIRAAISVTTPRIICGRANASKLPRDTEISVKGKAYKTKDAQFRGDIATIYLKEA